MNINKTSTSLELSKQEGVQVRGLRNKIVSKWSDRHSWRRVTHAE